jgi:protein farnesyltransferase subunit beta
LYDKGENDVRGIYCALVSAYLTDNLDVELAAGCMERLWQCQTFEGGFGSHPHCEAHGGYTFCAVASLAILQYLYPKELVWSGIKVDKLVEYCTSLQCALSGGFAGRTNKLVDGCYSFWLAGSLQILHDYNIILQDQSGLDKASLGRFILNVCQVEKGFRDKPGKKPDLYHTCYCFSGLALALQETDGELIRLDPIVNVEQGKAERMRKYFSDLKNK